jgi:hypothetical protein
MTGCAFLGLMVHFTVHAPAPSGARSAASRAEILSGRARPGLSHGRCDARRDNGRAVVLPARQHHPAGAAKGSSRVSIPATVRFEFLLPKLGVRLRPRGVLRAAVPVAAVDETRDLHSPEHEVRPPANLWDGAGVDLKPQPESEERGLKRKLRLGSGCSDGLHSAAGVR